MQCTKNDVSFFIKVFFLVFFLQASTYSFAQVKVLFIGSSLTGFNNLPDIFNELAIAAGKEVLVENCTLGGFNLDDHCNNEITIEKIYREQWDYVVLEHGNYQIANSINHWIIKDAIDCLSTHIYLNCSTSKLIFYLDYSMKEGLLYYDIFYSFHDFQQMLYDGTMALADELNLIVAPVGAAWGTVYDERPEIEMYHADNAHPALAGSYLGACVYYSVIFREELDSNNYLSSLVPDEAYYLQSVSSSTVMDNPELWKIFTSVRSSGEISVTQLNDFSLNQNYPNPFNPYTIIVFSLPLQAEVNLKVYDLAGKLVAVLIDRSLNKGVYNVSFDSSGFSSGTYYYVLMAGGKKIVKKMMVLK